MDAEGIRIIVKIEQLRTFLGEELSYPIDQESVIEQIGTVEIEAPDQDDSETIATIVDSLGRETYGSADELYNTIIGNVNEEHIGRKFYDDRGQHSVDSSEGPEEERDISF